MILSIAGLAMAAEDRGPAPGDVSVERMFKMLDADGNGQIDKTEMDKKLPELMRKMHESKRPDAGKPEGERREAPGRGEGERRMMGMGQAGGPPPQALDRIEAMVDKRVNDAIERRSGELVRRIEQMVERRVNEILGRKLAEFRQKRAEAGPMAGPDRKGPKGEPAPAFRPPWAGKSGKGEGMKRDGKERPFGPPAMKGRPFAGPDRDRMRARMRDRDGECDRDECPMFPMRGMWNKSWQGRGGAFFGGPFVQGWKAGADRDRAWGRGFGPGAGMGKGKAWQKDRDKDDADDDKPAFRGKGRDKGDDKPGRKPKRDKDKDDDDDDKGKPGRKHKDKEKDRDNDKD